MFIAHLPSGYLMSKYILGRMRHIPATAYSVFIAGMTGAVAPDMDMAYFYLVDHRQTPHHAYITHWPLLWLSLALVSFMLLRYSDKKRQAFLAMFFSLGGVLHMLLDSFVGNMRWFAPFIDTSYSLFSVLARFHPWWLNYILHWSFVMELVIVVWAVVVYKIRGVRNVRCQSVLGSSRHSRVGVTNARSTLNDT